MNRLERRALGCALGSLAPIISSLFPPPQSSFDLMLSIYGLVVLAVSALVIGWSDRP